MNIFIIGNGESRKDFDLNLLKGSGFTIGCNAIYDEFKPDTLISVDTDMIEEIRKDCKFLKEIMFIYRKRYGAISSQNELILEYVRNDGNCKRVIQQRILEDKGWASGPTAVLVCLRDMINPITIENLYLIGFDLSRLQNGKGNSMYKGRKNYIGINSNGATHSTSMRQLKILFGMFENVNFKRVIDNGNFPNDWAGIKNIKNITYKEFLNDIKE